MQKTGNYFQFPCRRLASASAAAAGLGGTHDAVVGYEPAGLVAIISSFAGVLLKSNQHLNAPCPENCEPADRPGNVCHINQMNTGKHELGRTRAGKVHPLTCRVIWHRFFFLQEFHEDIARQLNIPEDAVSDALNITSKLLAAPDYLFETGKHRVLTTGGEKIAEIC